MKKFLFYYLVVSLSVLSAQSQESFQIDSTSKWIQAETWASASDWEDWNYSLSFKGDTLINDTTFFKMFLNGQMSYDYWGFGSGTDTLSGIYFGAVFEDNGRVFMVLPDSSSSIPLYDFNYTINSVITTVVGNGLTITDIDTLENGRKKFLTNSSDSLFIIEGIGSNHGFFYNQESLDWLIDTTLGCYYQKDSLVFIYNSDVCYFPLPVVKVDNEVINSPYLYPNPANSIIRINTGEPITSLSIYNLQGCKQNLKFESPGQINISSLRNGLYLMVVNNKYTLKFTKN